MKLKIGKMKSKEIAEWFGITYNTYSHKIDFYQARLDDYCDFDKVYGGINIKEIYIDTYNKNYNKQIEQLYLDEIKECVEKQDGLASIAGMARKFIDQGKFDNLRTAQRQLSKTGNKLFGETKELTSHGIAGTREYMWGIKLGDYNWYRLMTEDEEKIFDDIICNIYKTNPMKIKQQALLDKQLKAKEISVEEYFDQKEILGLNLFGKCLQKFKEKTGLIVARCTQHELVECLDFIDEKETNSLI